MQTLLLWARKKRIKGLPLLTIALYQPWRVSCSLGLLLGGLMAPLPTSQVLWLDITASKARYGRWIDGCLPAFVPFPTTTRARTKQQKKDAAVEAAARAASDIVDDDAFIRLSRLRCKLSIASRCSGPFGIPACLADA